MTKYVQFLFFFRVQKGNFILNNVDKIEINYYRTIPLTNCKRWAFASLEKSGSQGKKGAKRAKPIEERSCGDLGGGGDRLPVT